MKVGGRSPGGPLPRKMLSDPRLTELALWGGKLAAEGLSPATSGNLSCRTSPGFLITRTGVALSALEASDWVHVTGLDRMADGRIVVECRGDWEASKDAALHAVLYERLPEAQTIFHLHVGNLEEVKERLGVPETAEHFPAGTTQSVNEIERLLDAHPGVRYFVLIQHGIVAWGTSPDEVGSLVLANQASLEGLD